MEEFERRSMHRWGSNNLASPPPEEIRSQHRSRETWPFRRNVGIRPAFNKKSQGSYPRTRFETSNSRSSSCLCPRCHPLRREPLNAMGSPKGPLLFPYQAAPPRSSSTYPYSRPPTTRPPPTSPPATRKNHPARRVLFLGVFHARPSPRPPSGADEVGINADWQKGQLLFHSSSSQKPAPPPDFEGMFASGLVGPSAHQAPIYYRRSHRLRLPPLSNAARSCCPYFEEWPTWGPIHSVFFFFFFPPQAFFSELQSPRPLEASGARCRLGPSAHTEICQFFPTQRKNAAVLNLITTPKNLPPVCKTRSPRTWRSHSAT